MDAATAQALAVSRSRAIRGDRRSQARHAAAMASRQWSMGLLSG
ncbi:hypothetical protein SH501x_001331 [Pirellulaceae bacterium SH501]